MDWSNDALFFKYAWRDETSQFDNHPSVRWEGGSEYYSREYKCRVPLAFKDCDELIEAFIELMQDKYPETTGFWVDYPRGGEGGVMKDVCIRCIDTVELIERRGCGVTTWICSMCGHVVDQDFDDDEYDDDQPPQAAGGEG